MVKKYLSDCESASFLNIIQTKIIPNSNACIDAFIQQKPSVLFEQMKSLSKYQFDSFRAMIPGFYLDLWQEGLEHTDFTLKLCGAGGGGYILGIGTAETIRRLSDQYVIKSL